MFLFNVGDRVKDRISGLTGIVMSRAEHLFGCCRYWLQPEEAKDGKPVDGCWLDEAALVLVQEGVIAPRQIRMVESVPAPTPELRRTGGVANQPASATGPSGR